MASKILNRYETKLYLEDQVNMSLYQVGDNVITETVKGKKYSGTITWIGEVEFDIKCNATGNIVTLLNNEVVNIRSNEAVTMQ